MIDSASSTVKPDFGSNYNSPTLSATSNFSANETNPAIVSTSEPQEKLGEKVPHVPLRSSSNAKISSLSSGPMPEHSVADPISASRRGSKGSIQPESHRGSTASSRRSKKETTVSGAGAANQEKISQEQSTPNPKPKKRGGFLSFLNCCSPPENANTVELGDQAVPAKKTKAVQQKPGRQPTPAVKTNVSAAESSTGESKEVTEEGSGGPEYQEMKLVAKPLMMNRSSKEKVTTEKVGPPAPVVEPLEAVESPPPAAYRDPPLPPVPSSSVASAPGAKEEQGIPAQAAALATPPQLIEPEESVAEQGTTINDRTPQQEQRDSDIPMVDAPPPATSAEGPPSTSRELQQAQINLPPPPPRNGNGGPSTTNSATPSEKQQWLLPPLQPQMKGRKCLVLDLDETLVHSSFKVRHAKL